MFDMVKIYNDYLKYKKQYEREPPRHEHDIFIIENPIIDIEEFDLYPLINRACPPQFKPKLRVMTSPYSKYIVIFGFRFNDHNNINRFTTREQRLVLAMDVCLLWSLFC